MRTRDILKLKNFVTWLAEQPADREYDYLDFSNCPIAQYMKAMIPSIDWLVCNSREITYTTTKSKKWSTHPTPQAFEESVINLPRTFGAAHSRALVLLSETEKR